MNKAWTRITLGVAAVLLLVPGVIWLIDRQTLGVVALVGIAFAFLFTVLGLTSSSSEAFWPWFLGVSAVTLPAWLLLLGGLMTTDLARAALYSWVYVYAAGATGGLVLELLRGKGRLELPSSVAADPVPAPTAGGGDGVGGNGNGDTEGKSIDLAFGIALLEEQPTEEPADPRAETPADGQPPGNDAADGTDPFAPYGPRADIGFLARLTLGGLAAAVFEALKLVLVDNKATTGLGDLGRQLDTLAWAALFGATAIAVWNGAQALVDKQIAAIQSKLDAAAPAVDVAVESAQSALDSHAATTKAVAKPLVRSVWFSEGRRLTDEHVDRLIRSPEFVAEPSRELRMLATPDLQEQHQKTGEQLAEALGSLKAAQRMLRSAQRQSRRR